MNKITRSQIRKHQQGLHTQECHKYNFARMCNICKYSLESFVFESDLTACDYGLELRKE